MPINRSKSQTKRKPQDVLIASYDEDYDTLAVEILGQSGNSLKRIKTNADGELVVNTGGGEQALIADSATTSDVTYVGMATIGTITSAASWQVKKIDETVTDVATITWADGNDSYDNIWDNRAALSYS